MKHNLDYLDDIIFGKKMPMKNYYQTTPMTPSELLEAQGRAISQEDRILVFLQFWTNEWTAWALKSNYAFKDMEITSIRRALFNLEKQGKIVQRGFCPGPKGKPCGKYIAFTGKLF